MVKFVNFYEFQKILDLRAEVLGSCRYSNNASYPYHARRQPVSLVSSTHADPGILLETSGCKCKSRVCVCVCVCHGCCLRRYNGDVFNKRVTSDRRPADVTTVILGHLHPRPEYMPPNISPTEITICSPYLTHQPLALPFQA